MAIQIYTAFAPMVHIGALERTAAELDLELVAVAAEPFAVARAVLGNDDNPNYTAILCDIGGGQYGYRCGQRWRCRRYQNVWRGGPILYQNN